MSNYATKTDFKSATGIDTSKLATKADLTGLKAEVDKLDLYKLVPVPNDLSKLSDVVQNDFVSKVNNIDTSGFISKAKYDTDKSDLEKKLMMQTKKYLILANLLKKTDYNATICEIKNKIPSISSLATSSALTAVENKKPDVRNIIKKKHIWCENIRYWKES